MSETTSTASRGMMVKSLIASVQDHADYRQVVVADGAVIEEGKSHLVTWYDVYWTDLAGALAQAQLVALEAELGCKLNECVVEHVTSPRPSPVFPASSRVEFTRYCTAFTKEVAE